MKKGLLVAIILVLAVLTCGCSGGTDASTTTTTAPVPTSTTQATTTTTTTSLPPGVFETVRHEEIERRFTFSGDWTASNNDSASGKSFVYADSEGASLTVRFVGTAAAYVAKKSPRYGVAEVTLDGTAVATVDLYSAEEAWQQVVWETSELASGPHVLVIAWTGEKAAAAEGTNINIDAVEVNGVLIGRYQQTNAKLEYEGTWKATSDPSASGENFAFANSEGASVTIRFNGVQLTWLAKTSPAYGQAAVTVDGGAPITVDLYSAEVKWRQAVWTSDLLGSGSHTVVISWTGNKNAAATDTNINIDYLDVTGFLE
jgi:tRNA A37 threonylcarbamoyladenosine biosynthesis protein TsaE